jgi:hypothetical protein
MAVPYYGDFAEDDTVLIPFNTFSSDDPSASVTITDLADADIKVHKDGSTDEIATDGASVAINFDSITGNHLITIDTSVDAAYSTGSEYAVRIEGTTVDGATINAWVGAFSIERAGGALALLKLIQAAVITNAAGDDIAADIIAVKGVVDAGATEAKLLKYVQLLARSDEAIETDNATELTAINADGGSGAGDYSAQTDSVEALRDHIGDGTSLTEAGGDGDHLTEAGGDGDHLTEAGGDGDHLVEAGGTGDQLTGITGATLHSDYDAAKTAAQAGDAMTLAADAIKATSFDESTAYPLTAADTGATAVARTGADSDTLETLSDQIDTAQTELNKIGTIPSLDGGAQTIGGAIAKLADDNGGADFDAGTDSLQEIRDRGDAAWVTGAGGSAPTVEEIRAEMDSNSTQLAAIVADTNELQTDNIPGTLATIDGKIDTLDTVADGIQTDLSNGTDGLGALKTLIDTVDTVVDAVKLKTDGLNFSGNNILSDLRAINSASAAAIRLALSAGQIIPFTVDDTVSPSTTEFEADDVTEATEDHYKGRIVVWTSGDLAGQATDITAYELNGGKGHFTVTAMTEAPSDDDTGVII